MIEHKQSIAITILCLFGAFLFVGCSQKPKAPKGGSYYDGPMKPKGAAADGT